MNKFFYLLLVGFPVLSCTNETGKKKGISVKVQFFPFYKDKVYLEKISFFGERPVKIDSANVEYDTEQLNFQIPAGEESVYQLRLKEKDPRIYFVTDVPDINIIADRPDWKKYHFKNGGFNNALTNFLDGQKKIADSLEALMIRAQKEGKENSEIVLKIRQMLLDSVQKRDIAFADTVSSAGAFLFVNNKIDFGKNFVGTKDFVTRAAKRFPFHAQVQKLKEETVKYVSIFEEEYQVGDVLPDVSLPDQNGLFVSTSAFKGRYVFVDLWSSWCPPCFAYIDPKKKLKQAFSSNKLEIVSIAIDPEKQMWKDAITGQAIPGTHLIDENMWKGKAVMAMKFDSIPFNFLISPEGKILAKAIKPDSVLHLVSKFLQR